MQKNPDNLRIKANAGFSLVDVMVGMVIALLGIIIIFQVFAVSEGIKRTTTSGGEALQNGTSALFSLELSLKEAGYGIFNSTSLAPFPTDPLGTAPVIITAGAANASDSIVLRYRQSWDFASFPPNPNIPQFAPAPPSLTIETITVNAQAQLVSNIIPDPAPGGAIPYAVCPPSATCLPLAVTPTTVISDGVVLMKAEYGTDANANGVIDANEWSQVAPANVLTVNAVRIVVVARSAQPEVTRDAAGNILPPAQCATTIAPPTWIDSAALPLLLTANVGLAAGDDWKCYRYKTFENTVPLRNVVWRV